MARKLKTFQTSLGFYDLAIAAPSMKAALEAWGAGSNLFHQGVAKEADDPDLVAATMSKPAWCSSARRDRTGASRSTPISRPT
jgi:colicin import membrane protein